MFGLVVLGALVGTYYLWRYFDDVCRMLFEKQLRKDMKIEHVFAESVRARALSSSEFYGQIGGFTILNPLKRHPRASDGFEAPHFIRVGKAVGLFEPRGALWAAVTGSGSVTVSNAVATDVTVNFEILEDGEGHPVQSNIDCLDATVGHHLKQVALALKVSRDRGLNTKQKVETLLTIGQRLAAAIAGKPPPGNGPGAATEGASSGALLEGGELEGGARARQGSGSASGSRSGPEGGRGGGRQEEEQGRGEGDGRRGSAEAGRQDGLAPLPEDELERVKMIAAEAEAAGLFPPKKEKRGSGEGGRKEREPVLIVLDRARIENVTLRYCGGEPWHFKEIHITESDIRVAEHPNKLAGKKGLTDEQLLGILLSKLLSKIEQRIATSAVDAALELPRQAYETLSKIIGVGVAAGTAAAEAAGATSPSGAPLALEGGESPRAGGGSPTATGGSRRGSPAVGDDDAEDELETRIRKSKEYVSRGLEDAEEFIGRAKVVGERLMGAANEALGDPTGAGAAALGEAAVGVATGLGEAFGYLGGSGWSAVRMGLGAVAALKQSEGANNRHARRNSEIELQCMERDAPGPSGLGGGSTVTVEAVDDDDDDAHEPREAEDGGGSAAVAPEAATLVSESEPEDGDGDDEVAGGPGRRGEAEAEADVAVEGGEEADLEYLEVLEMPAPPPAEVESEIIEIGRDVPRPKPTGRKVEILLSDIPGLGPEGFD